MFNRLKRNGWVWPLLLICSQAQANMSLQSELVKQREWMRAEHQLIAGPVMFRDQATESYSEGYYPANTVKTAGLHQRKIADFDKTLTAKFLFNTLSQKLARFGYVTEYQCEQQSCGDISGWQALTDPLLDGESVAQFYILAKAPQTIGNGYLAIHVADLDGQPRVVADSVMSDASQRNILDIVLFNDAYSYKPEQLISGSTLYFALNSSTPQAGSDGALQRMAEQLQTNTGQHFVVVGHADSSGTALYNQALSLARAQEVRNQLIAKHGISSKQLSVAGAGATGPDSSFRKTVLVSAN